MTKPTIFDGEKHRLMTKAEHEQYLEDCAGFEAAAVTADQLAAARVSALAKLAKLGLTTTELNALVGNG